MFWSPRGALVIGAVYGVLIGLVVTLGGLLSAAGVIVRILLSAEGAMASLYVGYGVPKLWFMRMPGDERREAAAGIAFVSYLLVLTGYWLVFFLLSRLLP